MKDYLIVGAGLFGAVCARELTDKGYKCLVIDQRNHIGGNCYTENVEGINVHKYGPHIFHTNSKIIWDYVNRFASFNNFIYRPKVSYKEMLYSFPINLFTLYQMYGLKTPEEAKKFVHKLKQEGDRSNIEGYVMSELGVDIYHTFIKGYTEKQWGQDANTLPSSIIKRLPIRYTFDDNYFNDTYQGIPIGGYTKMVDSVLTGVEVKLNVDYLYDREYFNSLASKVIYTGPIDKFFDYKFGKLKYRSLKFEQEVVQKEHYQGCAVINYTERAVPFTRITEHKYFENTYNENLTITTKEYPTIQGDPYYPVNDDINNKLYNQYKALPTDVIFGGRLADYKYYDMHQVIASAIKLTK